MPQSSNKRKPSETIIKVEASEQQHKVLSNPLLKHTVGRIGAVMRRPGGEKPSENEISFGLNALVGLRPENTGEVLLCTQMVAVHEVAMEMLTRAKMAEGLGQMQEFGALSIKLIAMFERQYMTLAKVRRPQQTVRVEHISVNAGAQAVIGNVNPGDRGNNQIEGQPHASQVAAALAVSESPKMSSKDATRNAVPAAADSQRPLPHARRSGRQRRA